MSTSRPPGEQGMPELLRDLRRRIERLETKATVTVGPYKLTVDDGGRLVAKHLPTGAEVIVLDPFTEEEPVEE